MHKGMCNGSVQHERGYSLNRFKAQHVSTGVGARSGMNTDLCSVIFACWISVLHSWSQYHFAYPTTSIMGGWLRVDSGSALHPPGMTFSC